MTQLINVDSSFVQSSIAFALMIWHLLNLCFFVVILVNYFKWFLIIRIWWFSWKIHKERLLLLEIPQMKIDLAVGYEHHLKTTSSWLWMTYGFFDILEKMNFLQRYVHFRTVFFLCDSDVVTRLCWQLYDDDSFKMFVAE